MKCIEKTLIFSLCLVLTACRETSTEKETGQDSSKSSTSEVTKTAQEKPIKKVKKRVKPQYEFKFKGRSYPIYTRRIEPASGLSENEVAIHETQESIRLIYAEARSVGMSNMHHYNVMLKNRASELKELQKSLQRLKRLRKRPNRQSHPKKNKKEKK